MRSHSEIKRRLAERNANIVGFGIDGMSCVFDKLTVIASWGGGWDHVSVSRPSRDPSWEEMCKVKDIFFEDEEEAFQFHPKKSEYVNLHPHCLHIWRSQEEEMPMPPLLYV